MQKLMAIQTASQARCDSFPEADHLSGTDLFVIQVILHLIFSEVTYEHCIKDSTTIDMEYRYYHLMERIRATEVKIRNYNNKRYCGQEDYSPVVHGLAFSDKSWTKEIHKNDEPMAFQRAKAFSVGSGQLPADSGQMPSDGSQQSVADERDSVQKSENEDGRMKNEQIFSDRSSENEGMVREQFSKKKSEISGQLPVVSVQSAADSSQQSVDDGNVDGRMKNEEESSADDQCSIVNKETSDAGLTESGSHENAESNETSEDSDNTSHSSLLTPNCSEAADSSPFTSTETPEFIKVLERVSMRSRLHHLDYLGFTEEEMRQLAADPGFAQFQPEMAADMRKALAEHDSG